MKKTKRLLALLLSVLLILSLLAACASEPDSDIAQPDNSTPAASGNDTPGTDNSTAPPTNTPDNSNNVPAQPQTGTTASDDSFVRKTEEGTLTVGIQAATLGFDPINNTTSTNLGMVYDTLVYMDPETHEIIPWLAESWEWSDDYMTCTFKLRDNVYFSDGTKLTSSDVYNCYKAIAESASMTSATYKKINFETSSCPDDTTFIMCMNEVYAQLMYALTTPAAGIYSCEWAKTATADDWWNAPVGSGPYICVENVDGSHTSYVANENYWQGAPEAKELTIKYFADSTALFIAYESGEIDVAMNILADDAQRIIDGNVPNTTYQIATIFNFKYVGLCDYVEYFQDIRVRKAIAHAIDQQGCIDASWGILATPMDSTLSDSCSYYVPTGTYEYNPELARELLAEAGYSDGDIVLRMIVFNTATDQQLAEAIQAYLAEVGIVVNVESYVQPTAIPMLREGQADITLIGANSAFDAAIICEKFDANGTDKSSIVHDDELQELLTAGYSTLDPEERAEIYKELQQLVYDQCYNVPIANLNGCYCYRDYIENFPCATASMFNPWFCHFAD